MNRSTAGTAVVSSVNHSDNTNTASNAQVTIQSGGTSGGDAYLYLNIPSGQDWSWGIDNSDSDALKITDDANPSTGNIFWKMTSAGELTLPSQPAFCAIAGAQANVTGDLTAYTVTYSASERFDQNGDFDGVSTFTAPVDGKYLLRGDVLIEQYSFATNYAWLDLVTSNFTYDGSRYGDTATDSSNRLSLWAHALADMDAADTAYIELTVGNGTKTVDIAADTQSFSGYLFQ